MFKGTEKDPLLPQTVTAIRVSLGLTPEQLAERLGVTRRTVYTWESEDDSRNCSGPSRVILCCWANGFCVQWKPISTKIDTVDEVDQMEATESEHIEFSVSGKSQIKESQIPDEYSDFLISREEFDQLVNEEARLRIEKEKQCLKEKLTA